MWFPSLFAVRHRASRPRPAVRPTPRRLAFEALEDRNAPGSLAPDAFPGGLETSVFSGWSNDALVGLGVANRPATAIGETPGDGDAAGRPAGLVNPSTPRAADSRVPAADANGDRPALAPAGSRSDGGEAARFLAVLASPSAPVPVSGGISADNGHFEPIAQDGSVVTFLHEDVHHLTGDIHGDWDEVGLLTLDLSTGEGFFTAEGTFTGTVLGESGAATLRVHGEVKNFFVTDHGHFVITQGRDGLDGVHAWGTYAYTVGIGGSYVGHAHFDDRT